MPPDEDWGEGVVLAALTLLVLFIGVVLSAIFLR